MHYLLRYLWGWRALLAWAGLGLTAFVAVALAIRSEARNLRAWTRGRKTATGPSGTS